MTQLLASWIIFAISTGGYWAVAGLMALESACIPLPSEIIMPFSGYLAYRGELDLWLVGVAGALGCNIGSTVAYFVGAYGGRPAVVKWGKYVLLGPDELDRLDWFFDRFGNAAVLIARLLPAVRTFVSLPAGIARMPFWPFQIYTFVGSLPWCLALAYVGVRLGEQWDNDPAVQAFFHRFDWAVAAAIVILIVLFVLYRLRALRR